MEKMIGYIFGSLHNSEKAINDLNKNLKAQKRFNSVVLISILTLTVYESVCEKIIKKQEEKIEALAKEIDELKEEKEA